MLLSTIKVFSFLFCCGLGSMTSLLSNSPVTDVSSGLSFGNLGGYTTSAYRYMADSMAGKCKLNSRVARLLSVEGDAGKKNDVIFLHAGQNSESNQHLLYFGGDVQDYTENMEFHRDNRHYVKWNLETTAEILQEKFPNSYVWVIKPSKMQLKTFSVYSNFVTSDDTGCPSHSTGQTSWLHLVKLLKSASVKLTEAGLPNLVPFHSESNINLVGFSKGCVVLNQLLYDLVDAKGTEETALFLRSVKTMFWLDGGHAGGSNTYVTNRSVLSSLNGTGIKIKCFVTPYQVQDSNRKWIGKEHKKFVSILKELQVSVEDTILFEEQERSIDNHFSVLLKF